MTTLFGLIILTIVLWIVAGFVFAVLAWRRLENLEILSVAQSQNNRQIWNEIENLQQNDEVQ